MKTKVEEKRTLRALEKAKLKPWIKVEEDDEVCYECPNCHLIEDFRYKYCPWCGQHTAAVFGK